MRSQSLRAASPLLALLAALGAAATGNQASAQSDPFALPKDLTYQSAAQAETGAMLATIEVDGEVRKRMVHLEGRGDALTIDAEDARTAGLPVVEGASGAVRLDSIRVYKWTFDSLNQKLRVQLFRDNDRGNLRDLTTRRDASGLSRSLLSFRIDYDLSATMARGGSSIGGAFAGFVAKGNFQAGTTLSAVSDPAPGRPGVVRLDSSAQLSFGKSALSVVAGDFVSSGTQSQRPLRMGGVQIGTSFALRPDLVVLPLPAFSGTVAVPTTIDLVGADQRLKLTGIEPGAFTIRNVPAALGRGEISAVLTDSLGRETVQTSRFYISRDLLAPRLSAYAVNFGFVRRRYGLVSNDYGPAAASAHYRRGLSPQLTLEASGEWTAGLVNLGARADFTIAGIAKATVEGRFSRDSDAGGGQLLNVALESVGRRLSAIAGATFTGATYRDVASRLGDPAPPTQIFANLTYRLAKNTNVQLSGIYRRTHADARTARQAEDTTTLNASFQTRLSKRFNLFTAAARRSGIGGNSYSVSAGLSLHLGNGRRGHAFASRDNGRSSGGLSYTRDALYPGDIGYRGAVEVSEGSQRVNAGVTWRAPQILLDGEIEQRNGDFAARGNARGTLLVVGGGFYARNTTSSGYALVRTGTVEGVPVMLENRLVGRTGRNGKLLVEGIVPLSASRIDVDADKLPAQAVVRETLHTVSVPERAVALVEIDAVRFVPVMRAVVDADGKPLAAGTPVKALPSGATTLAGFDGLVEINAGAGDHRLLVSAPGRTCVVDLKGVMLERDDGAPLVCTPITVAAEEALRDPKTALRPAHRKRGAQKVARSEAGAPRR